MTKRITPIMVFVVMVTSVSWATDWPQFRGPQRDGRSPETGLLQAWPQGGPKLLWTVDGLGEGWSGVAVSGEHVYVTGMENKREFIVALDGAGKRLWTQEYGSAWNKSFPGARSTPTVDGERIYVISGSGEVVCLMADDGKIVWSVPARNRFEGEPGMWGTAESPLVYENKVFYTPCGETTTVVALDKMTGETLWTSDSLKDPSGYVSPILVEHNGRPMLITVTGRYVIGVDSKDGTLLWNYPYVEKHPTAVERRLQINTISPLYHAGDVLVTSGYDHVAVMLSLSQDGDVVTLKWENKSLDCHHGGVVYHEGFVYGSNWEGNAGGKWMCLDWETGEARYETGWNDNKGAILYADGRLYCSDEDLANMGLVEATPEGFTLVGSIEKIPGEDKFWAHPSIANGRLYLRHGEFLRVYDIQAR